MAKTQHLKAWRKFRHLTQKQVVDRLDSLDDDKIPSTEASLSRIETGQSPYSQRMLEALSEIYQCEPWELLARDPSKEGKVYDLLARLSPAQMDQAEALIAAIAYPDDVRKVADNQREWIGVPPETNGRGQRATPRR